MFLSTDFDGSMCIMFMLPFDVLTVIVNEGLELSQNEVK